MTPRTHRLVPWFIAAALTGAGAWAVICAAIVPLAKVESKPLVDRRPQAGDGSGTARAVSFADVARIQLRQPLTDAPAPVATVRPGGAAPTAPPMTLVGTIAESGRSLALLQEPSGHRVLKSVGQDLGGAVVVAVTNKQATVRWQGQLKVLSLPAAERFGPALAAAPTSPVAERDSPARATAPSLLDPATDSTAEPGPDPGVPIDERSMRALLDRPLAPIGN